MSRTALLGLITLALAAAFAAGLAVGGEPAPQRRGATAPAPAAAEPESEYAGPRRVVAGVSAGFARTREGAVAAATAYGATGALLLAADDDGVVAAIDAMAAAGARDRLLADARQARDALAAELGAAAAVRWREGALALRVDAHTDAAATVSVWRVGVLWAPGAAPPQAQWATARYELVWERGDWKLAGQSSAPGPVPITAGDAAPLSAQELDRALDGFTAAAAP